MKKVSLALALTACFAAQPAFAEAYRLAYSKAENIEIFIDHSGANWCSDALNMRAVYGGAADQEALGKLLPKVGVLLGKQCPQATSLRWISSDASGKPLAHGTSTKAASWALLSDMPAAPAVAAPAPAPVTAAPASAPAAQEPFAPAVAAQAPVIAAPVVPAPVAQALVPAVQEPATPPATAPEAVAPAAAPAPVSLRIAGWQPASRDEVLAGSKRLRTLKDQNGCKIVSTFDMDEAMLAYVELRTEGLSCDAQGYATGKGKVRMERSDGARLAQTNDVWLSGGLIFSGAVAPLNLTYYAEGRGNAWFDLGSDGSRFQYLARASRSNYGSGLTAWRIDRIDVLTTQPEAFRNSAEIKVAVDQALRVVEERALPRATRLNIVFADNFEQGVVTGNSENLVYAIDAYRNSNGRGEISGEWRYNLQNGQNYLFRRDEIAARRKQEELRRQAYREQDNLRQYDNLVEQAKNNKAGVLGGMLRDLRYEPIFGGSYASLMDGRVAQVRLVVHVDDRKDNEAVLDWPYEMRIPGSELKDGWYLVQGSLKVDPKRRDDKGLPMSLLTLDNKTPPHACRKDGCADLNDPLVATRMVLGLPDWTPDQARAVIQQAEQR